MYKRQDLNVVVGNIPADKGIESLTYANGLFYAGIQETSIIHVVALEGVGDVGDAVTVDDGTPSSSSETLAPVPSDPVFPEPPTTDTSVPVAATDPPASTADSVPSGSIREAGSFAVDRSPSGMFYDDASSLVYVLCRTTTNGDHHLYAFTTTGDVQCEITIPTAAGMSRVCLLYTSPSPRD